MNLPNGKVVDILTPVSNEIKKWLQNDPLSAEAGGYIVGYQHKATGNISLEGVSYPFPQDKRTRLHFDMKDFHHKAYLLRSKINKSYYLGVWHTHPQDVPIPSSIDLNDWHRTLELDKSAADYMFFIIAGRQMARIWVGNQSTQEIIEIHETRHTDGLYQK